MSRQIFYSWQSDLQNSTNRSFIENCIKAAINDLNKDIDFHLEVALDRDTQGLTGTPDIANSILDKISNSDLFIADISIINKSANLRKTPNPNVLVELGYAAKALGWDRVVCIYNLDEGSYEDLPFDLRVRRPLAYSLTKEDKKEAKKHISKIISDTIKQLYVEGKLINEIKDYIKVQFDSKILSIINHLLKIIYGYEYSVFIGLEAIQMFLNHGSKDIEELLSKRKLLGFQIFKSLRYIRKDIEELIKQPIIVNELNMKTLTPIIALIKHIEIFENINNERIIEDLFIDIEEKDKMYSSIKGTNMSKNNAHLPDRYILALPIDTDKFTIQDFGDFKYLDKVSKQLNYFKFNPSRITIYSDCLAEFIKIFNNWIDNTGGEMIIDNLTTFKIHREPLK